MNLTRVDPQIDAIIRRQEAETLHEPGGGHDGYKSATGRTLLGLTVYGFGHRSRQ